MAGNCVERLPHNTDKCNSVDSLQVFEENGEFTGYCFACRTFVPDPYKDKPPNYKPTFHVKTEEEIQEEIADILTCQALDLPDRKLRKETLDYFGTKVGVDQSDGVTPALHYYPYTKDGGLRGFKTRLIANKRMWSTGDLREVDLFGWEQAVASGAKTLYIVEGEIDAMSLYQIIKDLNRNNVQWRDFNPAVASVPHGSSAAAKDILAKYDKISKTFKSVVYIPDNDEAGAAAKDEIVRLLPDVLIATLPCKDVNDCLLNGKSKAVQAAMFAASRPKNTSIIKGSSLAVAARKRPEHGLAYPWDGLTKATRGIRPCETLYWGAAVKMGKSEVVNALASNLIVNHKRPVFLVKPEEQPARTYQCLVGKAAGAIFHDPDRPFDEKAFEKGEKLVGDLALIQDVYQFVDWDTLKGDIQYVVKSEGVEHIFLDPITCFTNQMSSAEANEFLTGMAAEISAMAKDLKFTANLFCHLKAPDGTPHERGGKVFSNQFAGSRAMMRSCNYMIGIEGNKDPSLPLEERNMRQLVILEDREFGSSDTIRLYWDHHTGLFNEVKG